MTKSICSANLSLCNQATVTIVTLSLGLSDTLILTLMSVKNQSQSVRHILVDGSEKDEIREYCRKNFPKVEVYSQSPQGIYRAMNFGLDNVDDYSYVMFLNEADFLLGPEAISKLISTLTSIDNWVYGGTLAFSINNEKTFELGYKKPNWKNFKLGLELIPHPSSLIPAYWLKNQKGYKHSLKIAADTDMNFRIYKKHGSPIHIQELISAHEIGGISSVLETRSNFESRLARLQNFPLATLQKFLKSLLTRKKLTNSINPTDVNDSAPEYQHYRNCLRNERIPLCCRHSLLDAV
jgi:hypothetical protein